MSLTYPEVGATRAADLPAGYGHLRRDVAIGRGRDAFERAAEGLLTWRMHRLAGLAADAGAPRAGVGVVVRLGVAGLTFGCQVVYLVDEPRERGFAYGTLPGHPERGEESFTVTLDGDGVVRARIRAFSRPATRLARAGGPVTRLVQAYVTGRYVRALRRLAQQPAGE